MPLSSEIKECSGLHYKHMMIVNYASSMVNKLEALLTDNAWVVIYDRHVFIVQATDFQRAHVGFWGNVKCTLTSKGKS